MALEHGFRQAFEVCPVCGRELAEKEVEKLLCGGNDTATLQVDALVCLHCGERLYPEHTIRRFERIRQDLAHQRTAEIKQEGRA